MKKMMFNPGNYEAAALDYLEGTLSEPDRAEFERLLESAPEVARQVASLQRSMPELVPDVSVRFDGKASLKRKASLRIVLYRTAGVAAVLLVALLAWNQFGTTAIDPVAGEDPSLLASGQSETKLQPETAVSEPELTVTVAPEISVQPEKIAAIHTTTSTTARTQTDKTDDTANPVLSFDRPAATEPLTASLELISLEPVVNMDAPAVAANGLVRKPTARVVEVTEGFVSEATGLPVAQTIVPGSDRGFLNLLSRKGMKQLITGIITPLSELSPVKVYEDNEQRVVELASIPVSRKSNQTQE